MTFSNKFLGKSFCFTGAIHRLDDDGNRFTREMIHQLVYENGGEVTKTVNVSTSYLVRGNGCPKTSTKLRKASYGRTPILSEDEFFRMVIPKHVKNWMARLKEKLGDY